MIFVFLCLISLSIIPSRSIHVVTNGRTSFFFLWLSSIPWCIYHIFFIHSSTDGPLDCFHVLGFLYLSIHPSIHLYIISLLIGGRTGLAQAWRFMGPFSAELVRKVYRGPHVRGGGVSG